MQKLDAYAAGDTLLSCPTLPRTGRTYCV
jgi:hypothetical protein